VLVDLGVVDERLQLLDAELPAGDRREPEKLVALRREPVETPADDVPDALWNADAPVAPAHGPVHQASLVDEQADDLGHEQRVSLGPPVDRLGELGREGRVDARLDEATDLRLAEAPHRYALEQALPRQLCERVGEGMAAPELCVATRADDEHRGRRRARGRRTRAGGASLRPTRVGRPGR
jgi:hypothetical protein